MKPSILITNGVVMTFGPSARVFDRGAVLVRDGLVAAVGPMADVEASAAGIPDVKTIDARGAVVTPGLINAHMHLYSTFACGIACATSHNFQEILENLWWRLDKAMTLDDTRLSALVPAARCLKAGVTTIIDHHASYGKTRGSLNVVADACRQVGLRAAMAYEVSDRWGEAEMRAAVDENAAFIAGLDPRDTDIAGLFGLHASFTLSAATLALCREAAKGAGFHIHCAEDKADAEAARREGFAGAADRLHQLGILGPKTITAHCIHVTDEEVRALADTKTTIVTNPQSNMNNAVGVANVPKLLEAGCTVGLGSDGMTADILREMAALIFTQRQRMQRPDVMFAEAVNALCVTNPAIASAVFGKPVGILAEGAAGDVVVWDYVPVTPMSDNNAMGHTVFGLTTGRPWVVVSSGHVVVDDYQVTTVSEQDLATESRALAEALWRRW